MSATTASIVDRVPFKEAPKDMSDAEEQALLQRILNGDESGFELLVKQPTVKVIGLAWRLAGNHEGTEDLAQEAILQRHRFLPSFRGESYISTWLYRITTRLAIDHLRRERITA